MLGSGSPRRRELLQGLGLRPRVWAPEVDESVRPEEPPLAYLERVVTAKAMACVPQLEAEERALLVADTSVLNRGAVLGKPSSRAHGRQMLLELSAAEHVVATRYALWQRDGEAFAETVQTRVRFRELSTEEIERYLDSGEGEDKAGGYGVQGHAASFVQAIVGSYTNVVGLPLAEVAVALRRLGLLS